MNIGRYCIPIIVFIFFLPLVIGIESGCFMGGEFTTEMNFNISLSEKYKNRVDFTVTNIIYTDEQIQFTDFILEPVKPSGIILPESLSIHSNKGSFDIKIIPEIVASLHVGCTDENGTRHTVTLPGDVSSEKDKLEIKKSSKEPLSISKDDPLILTFSMVMDGFIHEYAFNSYGIQYYFGVPEVNNQPNHKNIFSGRVEIPFGFFNYSKDKTLFIPYIIDCSNKKDSLNYSFDQTDKKSIILISAPEHKEDFYLDFLFALRDSSKTPIKITVEDVLDATKNNRVVSEVEICNENYGNILNYDLSRDSINNEVNGIKFLRGGGRTLEKGKCSPKQQITFEKYSNSKKNFNWYPIDSEVYSGQRNFSSLLNIEEGFETDFEIFHTFKLITKEQFGFFDAKINYTYNLVESISDLDIPKYQKEGINRCKEGRIQLAFDQPFLDESSFEQPPSSSGGIFIYKKTQNFLVYSPFREGYYNYYFHVKRSKFESAAPLLLLIIIFIIGTIYLLLPQKYIAKIPFLTKKDWIFWFTLTAPQAVYQYFFRASFTDFIAFNSITLWLGIIIYLWLIIVYLVKKRINYSVMRIDIK